MAVVRVILSLIFMLVSVLANTCALIALKRSKMLCPNIRLLSMNLLVSNILFCTVGAILLTLGVDFTSGIVDRHCFARLLGSAVLMEAYFVTSFSIIAMAMDRLGAIVSPFKYIEFLHGTFLKKVCFCLWVLSFLIVITHNIVNASMISNCVNSNYVSARVSLGIVNQTFIVIGISNLMILIVNIGLFVAIIVQMKNQNYREKECASSILRKIAIIFVAYAILYIPFCVVTIAISLISDKESAFEPFENVANFLLLFGFIIDPFLYAWRYKMCRLQMMKILCFFWETKVEEITKTLNEHYCTYEIRLVTTRRRVSSVA